MGCGLGLGHFLCKFSRAFRLRQIAGLSLPRPFSWQPQCFVDLDKNVAETRKPLVTLCMSERSHSGVVRTLMALAQPSRRFVPVRSLSLWRGANVDIARATLSALCACQITLVSARC